MTGNISGKKVNTDLLVSCLLTGLLVFLVLAGFYEVVVNAGYIGDNYFMFANARVLLKEGFVTKDPLSMHSSFEYVVPQWAFSLLIYILHDRLGDQYNFYLLIILFLLIFFLLRKICRLVAGAKNYIVPLSFIFGLFAFNFNYLRPYLVTTICNLVTLCILEKTYQDNRPKRLLWLPVISVIQVNFHNSLWISLFLILACYLAEEGWKLIRKEDNRFGLLIFVAIVCIGAGFVNPYGWGYMTYIFNSMISILPFKAYIKELAYAFDDWQSIIVCTSIMSLDVLLSVYVYRKNRLVPPIRYVLLCLGFLCMAVFSLRNLLFFFSCGQLILMFCISKTDIKTEDGIFRRLCRVIVIAGLFVSVAFVKMDIVPKDDGEKGQFAVAEYLSERIEDKNLPVFSTFNTGAFLEYFELKPYMDARAEVFGIANNKKEDVASLYMHLHAEGTDKEYQELFDRYDFRYAVTDGKTSDRFLSNSPDYVLMYSYNGTKLYGRLK